MHLIIEIIMIMIIAGMTNNVARPKPSGSKTIIITKPIMEPIIVKIIFSANTPTFTAAKINIKNIKIPIIRSIMLLSPHIIIYNHITQT